MSGIGRKLARAFWAVDRALGGEQPPTWVQRFTASHPLGLALSSGAAWAAFFLLLPDTQPSDLVIGPVGGILLGGIVGLTGRYEKSRQRRLLRQGLWDGS
jgi:hypothetical protein